MRTSWMDVKCKCRCVWNIRAPALHDILAALREKRIMCLRCGSADVKLDIPDYKDLEREMGIDK